MYLQWNYLKLSYWIIPSNKKYKNTNKLNFSHNKILHIAFNKNVDRRRDSLNAAAAVWKNGVLIRWGLDRNSGTVEACALQPRRIPRVENIRTGRRDCRCFVTNVLDFYSESSHRTVHEKECRVFSLSMSNGTTGNLSCAFAYATQTPQTTNGVN